uniref:Uncharacterized protein n=1 Tax=Anguilla anguilla TaxID=7936 RepID=A0A0E9T249_ANGAN
MGTMGKSVNILFLHSGFPVQWHCNLIAQCTQPFECIFRETIHK